jgi:hypothetical protein
MSIRATAGATVASLALLPACSVATDVSMRVVATSACVKAQIGGQSQCLIAGHRCDPRYDKKYERHGFKCRRNTAGKYRLWTPIRPGQPKP